MTKEKGLVNDLADKIFEGAQNNNFLGLSKAHLQNVAYYDFTEYQYILEPKVREFQEPTIDDLDIGSIITDPTEILFLQHMRMRLEELICQNSDHGYYTYWVTYHFLDLLKLFPEQHSKWNPVSINEAGRLWIINVLIAALIASESYGTLLDLFRLALKVVDINEQEFIDWLPIIPENSHAFTFFWTVVLPWFFDPITLKKTPVQLKFRWNIIAQLAKIQWEGELNRLWAIQYALEQAKEKIKAKKKIKPYTFEPFLPNSWNLGMRVIYRQEWRPLGNQRGEVVKTIPLGPKQVEKVTTKIIRRTKVTKTAETLRSVEETSEVTDTTKDSNEIVNEASETFGWNVEAEASVGFSVFSASISGGAHGETEQRSKQASTHLSESMQKTASKIKTETKTVVTTESESTYEIETASEISNPNEEIPITYVYSKLLRQYEIFTSVVEIQNIIFIAEPLPRPYEVNFEWVKRYDWILAKVLLDDSFRDALSSVSQSPAPLDYSTMQSMLGSKLGDILGSATSPGFLERFAGNIKGGLSLNGIDMIQEAQKNYKEALQNAFETERELDFLEIKRKRLYQHIRDNILHYCRAIWSQEDPQQRILRYKQLDIRIPTMWDFYGMFGREEFTTGDVEEGGDGENPPGGEDPNEGEEDLTLDDLINKIKQYETDENEMTVFDLDGEFRGNGESTVDITELVNPIGPIGYYGNYAIYNIKPEFIRSELFTMLQIMKTPYLYYQNEEDENPILMDPELKRLTQDHSDESPRDEDEKLEMIEIVPNLRILHSAAEEAGEEDLDEFLDDKGLFKQYFPEYLFRKERSRRFLLDTQNLLIDIQPGAGTVLESYKLAHRGMDVLKTMEEKRTLELENERREHLLKKQKYNVKYWPGAEKVVIFDDGKNDSYDEVEASTSSNTMLSGPLNYPIRGVRKLKRLVAKLEELGIYSTLKLLQKSDTVAERRKIIQLLEVTQKELKDIIAVIDLMRIKDLNEEEAELLDAIGINSVKELARRNSKKLFEKLEEYGEENQKKVPEESKVQDWIERAKHLI